MRSCSESVRFYLSYDPIKWDFDSLQNDHYFNKKRIVDTDIVNDVTSTHQSVIRRVVIRSIYLSVFNVTRHQKHIEATPVKPV